MAEVIQKQYVIGVHLASVGASIAGTLILLLLLLMIAALVHSCCFGGQCCGAFWSFIFKCICRKCDHEDPGGQGGGDDCEGQWQDPRLKDHYFTKYYMSKPAAQYRWPENGKSNNDLPYDTGNAISDVPLPVTVQCPDGGVRTLGPSDLNQNLVTASPITIAGVHGVPPNTPNSTYTGTGSRRQSLSRYGTISRSPSMPSLREERIENDFSTMTLPRNAGRLRQQQALINASRRASLVSGSFPEYQAGGVNLDVTGRRVSFSASSANDFGGTEVGAAVSVNEAATKAAKAEASASAENENGFLEPF